MAPKGEDGSWLRNANVEEMKSLDSVSVWISNMEAQDTFKRQQTIAAGEPESDGEGDYYNGCFPRGRVMSRKVYTDSANMKGAPFARLDTEDPKSVEAEVKSYQRSHLLGAIYCCCGPCGQPDYTVEVRAVDLKSSGDSKQEPAANSKWEVDTSEQYCKPPYWKQLARKAKAHVHVRQAHLSRCDWLNYDPYSYQMNFDDGCRQENYVSSLYIDENDDSPTRERAMHSALLKKFAGSPAQRVA